MGEICSPPQNWRRYLTDVKCRVHIYSDTTICSACDMVWNTNDPDPPPCPKRERVAEYAETTGLLKGLAFGLPLSALLWTVIYFVVKAVTNG